MIVSSVPQLTPKHPAEGRKRVGEPVVHLRIDDRAACAWCLDGDFADPDRAKVTCEYCKAMIRTLEKSESLREHARKCAEAVETWPEWRKAHYYPKGHAAE